MELADSEIQLMVFIPTKLMEQNFKLTKQKKKDQIITCPILSFIIIYKHKFWTSSSWSVLVGSFKNPNKFYIIEQSCEILSSMSIVNNITSLPHLSLLPNLDLIYAYFLHCTSKIISKYNSIFGI